jgi:hypothetical protein
MRSKMLDEHPGGASSAGAERLDTVLGSDGGGPTNYGRNVKFRVPSLWYCEESSFRNRDLQCIAESKMVPEAQNNSMPQEVQ